MIWVIGELGQIGGALVRQLGPRAIAPPLEELDLSFPDQVVPYFDALAVKSGPPVAVINAAAYTLVDRAEHEESLARRINADAPGQMALWCARHRVPFVHYSTDYVYSGAGTAPWREDAATEPVNAYGRTKLAGDELIQRSGAQYLILRTSWVYDASGKNFFTTIMRLARERDVLEVVADQIGTPNYAPHLARFTLDLLDKAMRIQTFPAGIYHFSHAGEVSWHRFAKTICDVSRDRGVSLTVKTVSPIPTVAYPTPAKRPSNSRLDTARMRTVFDTILPRWEHGLDACVDAWLEDHR
jgi:dTDP-4-dehydrorhamnose reductase